MFEMLARVARGEPVDTATVMTRWARTLLGVYLYAWILFLIYGAVCLWPLAQTQSVAGAQTNVLGRNVGVLNSEQALMWIIAVLGALGGSIHAAGSFSVFVGNRNLVGSWLWWYLARAPIGAALALGLFFVLRGGLLAGGQAADRFNIYGLSAIAILTGLFSQVATDKLREVFEVLFRPEQHKEDPVEAKAPTLLEVHPSQIDAGSGPTAVVLRGRDFDRTDEVMLQGKKVENTFVGPEELDLTVPIQTLEKPGTLGVTVRRAGPAGLGSQTLPIEVTAKEAVTPQP